MRGLIAIAIAVQASRADAFCGFYIDGAGAQLFNHATQVVLMRHGTTTVLAMQNNYAGPPESFALVVPVPVVVRESQVKTLPRDVFARVDALGAPRLVEYWEQDPCGGERWPFEGVYWQDIAVRHRRLVSSSDDHVRIEAQFAVGEYDIVVLSATESTGLERWLRANHYRIPAGVAPLLRPYVEQGTKFFVAKVDPKRVRWQNGMATLSPLRIHYDSSELTLPIRLGLASSPGTQDLIVNVLAPGDVRYEVANRPNVTIPTNLTVSDEVRTRFGELYAALFDHTLAEVPGAVVTEYAWNAGTCDPCPGPALSPKDIATLGGDVIDASYGDVGRFTLTRLHLRYGKDVADDLVFRAVGPIAGGRGIPDIRGNLSVEVEGAVANNFQARYVILHRWDGALTCDDPQRGVWGGPRDRHARTVQPATDLAFAPRGGLDLDAMVTSDIAKVGILASGGRSIPMPLRRAHGCGCRSEGSTAPAVALVVLGLVVRRRATARSSRR